MSAKTLLEELDDLRQAIQALAASGATSVSIDGVTYTKAGLDTMQRREAELYRRLSIRNVRKRTFPDYT